MVTARLKLPVALLVIATLAGCAAPPSTGPSPTTAASASAAAGPQKGGTLRIGYGAEVDNLNAFTSQFLTDIELTMVEGLIVSNDKNEYIPVLAKQGPDRRERSGQDTSRREARADVAAAAGRDVARPGPRVHGR
jgi:ABC-type transport system substrate-binding protein